MSTVLGALVGAVGLALALHLGRPGPERGRGRSLGAREPAAVEGGRGVRAAALGARLRRATGRPVDPAADVRTGRAVLAGAVLVPLDPLVALGVGATFWLGSWWRTRAASGVEERALAAAVPDLVDLVRLGVTAGLSVRGALGAAAAHVRPPLSGRVGAVLAEAEAGRPLADALAAADLGPAGRPLLDALLAGERYGAPLVDLLDRLAHDARRAHQARAEQAARRLPVALLFPLVLCTLPAFVLVTVVPVLVSTFAALDGR